MRAQAHALGQPAAARLAAYAAGLRYADLPVAVIERIKTTIADALIAAAGGAVEPAGRALNAYLLGQPRGPSALLDGSGRRTGAATAALANGIFAHAAEADSLRRPGAGVHPGATIVPAALAVAQEVGADGRSLIEAVTAGVEVMFRIGRATLHSAEQRGFHAPGLTGPFGAAVATAKLMRLDASTTSQAIGLAGSFASGLLAFAASGEATTVKPLHMGRAAESGILAARLAASGMRGPTGVLDGRMGFLEVYCTQFSPELLVAGLYDTFESLSICFKAYPCHITAHAPVNGALQLRERHGLRAADVGRIELDVAPKTARLNAIARPADVGLARYSVPFSMALALADDPRDPSAWARRLRDPAVLDLANRVGLRARAEGAEPDPWSASFTAELKDGRRLEIEVTDFPGTPTMPFAPADLERKLEGLVPAALRPTAHRALERLMRLEQESSLDWLAAQPDG